MLRQPTTTETTATTSSTPSITSQVVKPNLEPIKQEIEALSKTPDTEMAPNNKIDAVLNLLHRIGINRDNAFNTYYKTNMNDASLVKLVFDFIAVQASKLQNESLSNNAIGIMTEIAHDFTHLSFCLNHAGVRLYLELLAGLPKNLKLKNDVVCSIYYYFAENINSLSNADFKFLKVITENHLENSKECIETVLTYYEFSLLPTAENPKDPNVIQKLGSTLHAKRLDLDPAKHKAYYVFILQMVAAIGAQLDSQVLSTLFSKYLHYSDVLSMNDFHFVCNLMQRYPREMLLDEDTLPPLSPRTMSLILVLLHKNQFTEEDYKILGRFKPDMINCLKNWRNPEVQTFLVQETLTKGTGLNAFFDFRRSKVKGFFVKDTDSIKVLRAFAEELEQNNSTSTATSEPK